MNSAWPYTSRSEVIANHKIVSFDSAETLLLLAFNRAFLLLSTNLMGQVRPHASTDRMLHLHQLWVHGPLIVAVVSALLDYVVSLGALRDKWTSLLQLPVDQLDLLLHFLEELLKATLFEN